MPIASIFSQLIAFLVRFGVFLIFWLYFWLANGAIHPNLWILAFPVLLLIVATIGFSFGVTISSLTTKYRDFQQVSGVGIQILMYATPILYPLSSVPEQWRWLILLNPLTPVMEIFRLAFLGVSVISPIYLLYSIVFTMVSLFASIVIFNNAESTFLDTI